MGKKEGIPNRQYTQEFKIEAVRLAVVTKQRSGSVFLIQACGTGLGLAVPVS